MSKRRSVPRFLGLERPASTPRSDARIPTVRWSRAFVGFLLAAVAFGAANAEEPQLLTQGVFQPKSGIRPDFLIAMTPTPLPTPGPANAGPAKSFSSGLDRSVSAWRKDPVRASPWVPLAPAPEAAPPSLIAIGKGKLVMFGYGGDASDPYLVYRRFDGKSWSRWWNLGSDAWGRIGAVALGEGRMSVFQLAGETLRYRHHDGKGWSPWTKLGGPFARDDLILASAEVETSLSRAVSVLGASSADPSSDRMAFAGDETICVPFDPAKAALRTEPSSSLLRRSAPASGVFDQNLRDVFKQETPSAVARPMTPRKSDVVHVFVIAAGNVLHHRTGRGAPGSWGPWRSFGPDSAADVIQAAITRPDKVDLVGLRKNVLHHGTVTRQGADWKWSGWTSLEKNALASWMPPVVVAVKWDHLDVFLTGADKKLHHRRRSEDRWSPWAIAESAAQPLEAIPTKVSPVEILMKTVDHDLHVLDWDGQRYGKRRIGGYVATYFGGAPSPDKCRFDLVVQDLEETRWHKWWEHSAAAPAATGLEPKRYAVRKQGALCDLFGECDPGLVCTGGPPAICAKPPPKPVAPSPPSTASSMGGDCGAYAKEAVAQWKRIEDYRLTCALTGAEWHGDESKHHQWCLAKSPAERRAAHESRRAKADACLLHWGTQAQKPEACQITVVVANEECRNADGTASSIVPGSLTGTGCGASEESAEERAKFSFKLAAPICPGDDVLPGCCTVESQGATPGCGCPVY